MDELHSTLTNIDRRRMLQLGASGLGGIAMAGLQAAERQANHSAKAKRVIYLHMMGGPSQLDLFDYKPELQRAKGEDLRKMPSIYQNQRITGMTSGQSALPLVPSMFRFDRYPNREDGTWVSELYPHTGRVAGELCIVHSMHTDIPEHAGAMLMYNLGHLQPSRPSLGSWLCYGLGSENQELPGFVAMSPRAKPRGKSAHWGNSFLPGAYAGTYANIAAKVTGRSAF